MQHRRDQLQNLYPRTNDYISSMDVRTDGRERPLSDKERRLVLEGGRVLKRQSQVGFR